MENAVTLLILGGLFSVGLAMDEIGRRTRLPRVTLLILVGMLAGPVGFDLVPAHINGWYDFLSTVALTMVAFLLGGALTRDAMAAHGRQILSISIAVVGTTLIVVTGGLIALGAAVPVALLLAGIATATDPAATQDVMRQTGAKGPFAETLRGVVAIDDAWGLIAFSLMMIVARAMDGSGIGEALTHGLWDFGGAIAVGVAVGVPAAFLSARIKPGEPSQAEALAIVFISAGAAVWFDVSFLLAGVVAGTIVANFAKHHEYAFHEIENIEWPFMILFFILAGVTIQVGPWREFAFVIASFVVLRTVSRIIGAWLGVASSGARGSHNRWMGFALLPQAGVAIGMALVAANNLPAYAEIILSVTITTTVIFEIFGPYATLLTLRHASQTLSTGTTEEADIPPENGES